MSNWQSDLDRRLRARKEAEAKRKATEEARQKKQQAEQRIRERERQLQAHRRRYKCYICRRPSDGPTRRSWGGNEGEYDDWYYPAGLRQCSVCNKWACDENRPEPHIYRGVCQRDAQKGYLPGDKRFELRPDWRSIGRLVKLCIGILGVLILYYSCHFVMGI
jgi:hypothetical protein